MAAHSRSVGSSVGDWHHHLPLAVEALNGALEGIPPERVRFHVCWGNTGTPHTHDIRRQRVGRAAAPGRPGVIINTVFFLPGARTHWHRHEAGQILLVTHGRGLAVNETGDGGAIMPGDVVWFEPGERHWHGARLTPRSATSRSRLAAPTGSARSPTTSTRWERGSEAADDEREDPATAERARGDRVRRGARDRGGARPGPDR